MNGASILREDSQHHSPADMAHEINALNKLCKFCGNYVVEPCLDRNPELRPKNKSGRRKSSMSDETYKAILQGGLAVDPADFNRVRAYALVLLCIDTGTRNKEIRLAEVTDIDTRAWTLNIVHVKGKASYGEARSVPIRNEIRPVVQRYLEAVPNGSSTTTAPRRPCSRPTPARMASCAGTRFAGSRR